MPGIYGEIFKKGDTGLAVSGWFLQMRMRIERGTTFYRFVIVLFAP
jgi:hypothetical protein